MSLAVIAGTSAAAVLYFVIEAELRTAVVLLVDVARSAIEYLRPVLSWKVVFDDAMFGAW